MTLQSRCWLSLQSSECLTRSGKSASITSHSHGRQAGALVPSHLGLSTGLLQCSHNKAADFLQKEWSRRECDWRCNTFYGLASEVTNHHFHNILLIIQVSLFTVGENYTRAWMPGGKNHRQLFWNLAITPHEYLKYTLEFPKQKLKLKNKKKEYQTRIIWRCFVWEMELDT